MTILVSACLTGTNCKYNGGNNFSPAVMAFCAGHRVVTVCPECLGGLPTPRIPSEIVEGVVTNRAGENVDAAFRLGAERALDLARQEHIDLAVLQSRSPSCGVNRVYSGQFDGKLVEGNGIFAGLLLQEGFRAVDAEDIEKGLYRRPEEAGEQKSSDGAIQTF